MRLPHIRRRRTTPRDGATDRCTTCGARIIHYVHHNTDGTIADAWWTHIDHPADGHEATTRRTA